MARARALAVLGTASSVGKTLVTAGLGRLWRRRGVDVAPFKAQNMSNNAAVTAEGGEMGRAQVVQAIACGLDPHVDMNPVLLKPESDGRSQVVMGGRVASTESARAYFGRTDERFAFARDAYDRLAERHEAIVIEGAGSCAELNLMATDIVNWRTAHHADASVLLVGDIERGGIFAQLIGTYELLPHAARRRVTGFLVNKFRGDRSLFDEGVTILEDRTGVPVVGVIPRLMDLWIDDEDGADVLDPSKAVFSADRANIAVVVPPRISNMSDFTALAAEEDVALRYAHRPKHLVGADVIVLPGSKATIADLEALRESGMATAVVEHAQAGGHVVGLCGGYQMLGRRLRDPHEVEGGGSIGGLGLLAGETTLSPQKVTENVRATAEMLGGLPVTAYEIHCGRTIDTRKPAFRVEGRPDGDVSADGRIWGTYLHGVFDSPGFRRAWLNRVRADKDLAPVDVAESERTTSRLDRELDRWADHLERFIDPDHLDRLLSR